MKKKSVFATLFCVGIFATSLILTSCGGGGTSSSSSSVKIKDYPENEIFGKIPGILCQYFEKDSIFESQYDKEREKIEEKAYKAKNQDEILKLYEESEKLSDERDNKVEKAREEKSAAIEKEKAALIGKSIPFEMEEGTWYEITNLVITDVNSDGTALITGTFKVINEERVKKAFFSYPSIYCSCLDSQGNVICEYCNSNTVEKGDANLVFKTGFSLFRDSGKAFLDFAKVRFLNKD